MPIHSQGTHKVESSLGPQQSEYKYVSQASKVSYDFILLLEPEIQ